MVEGGTDSRGRLSLQMFVRLRKLPDNCKRTDKSKFEAHVWAGGFGAEFFDFDREAYLCTSEGENGKNKQKIQSKWRKP